ncbi:LLM class flavin-dependent oxidoreductase [Streptomyces sp. NPDC047017]|uniref:LLM class flavin-dependent oxidoreductase n=1 Tax=Streptomyces sp. NPDC047017 TaxID=3155024 RepID=UPI0033F594A7
MTVPHARGLLHLAAAVDRQSAYDAGAYAEAVRLAESGGLDFVTLDDSRTRPGPDALAVLTRAAPATHRIGLVPTVTSPHTGPTPVPAAVTALDRITRGRAGWRAGAPAGGGAGVTVGVDEEWGAGGDEWGEEGAGDGRGGNVDVRDRGRRDGVSDRGGPGDRDRLSDRGGRGGRTDRVGGWDVSRDMSRDGGVGRLAGRGEGRYGGGAGAALAGRAAPVASRSPQGCPVRVVDATEDPESAVRGTVARDADVVLIRVRSPARAAAVRDGLRAEAARSGRDPDTLRVLAGLVVDLGDGEYAAERGWGHPPFERARELGGAGGGPRPGPRDPLYRGGPVDLAELITTWHREGAVDGFHLVPAEPGRDLERLVNGTVALLQHRGLFRTFYPGSTLREHLGLGPVRRTGARAAGGGGRG